MSISQETEMSETELEEFLGDQETAVLSLARTDEPYAIPISYGYDLTDRTFFMRLVSTPDSEKRRYLGSSPEARLVIYDEDGDTYRSAVVVGSVERIPPGELTADTIAQYGQAKRPLFEIWPQGREKLDIELYELSPDRISGRKTELDRDLS